MTEKIKALKQFCAMLFHIKTDAASYYTRSLQICSLIMILHMCILMVDFLIFGHTRYALPVIPWIVVTVILYSRVEYIGIEWITVAYLVDIGCWMVYLCVFYGWTNNAQNFIIPALLLVMFSVYFSNQTKALLVSLIVMVRSFLYVYCLMHEPLRELDGLCFYIFRIMNTALILACLLVICGVVSSNIQKSEKELIVNNEALRHQASVDPLTQLPNRRYMLDSMQNYIRNNPESPYCLAIGDIDLFKNVNDTLGHNFGDQVLSTLSALFREKMLGHGFVGRWGGEEFLFFVTDANLDEAGALLMDIHISVRHTEVCLDGKCARVTMTFGVEECDFQSDLHTLLESADKKLYMGKQTGRNKVVI